MNAEVREIIEQITERFSDPIKIGSRCESNVFYSVEQLKSEEIEIVANALYERVCNVCSHDDLPKYIIELSDNKTHLSQAIASQFSSDGLSIEVIPYEKVNEGNGTRAKLNNSNVILVNDVITTARSCLEAHARTAMLNASIMCWVALIDRTFGPGPVPVVAAITGEPVTLIE